MATSDVLVLFKGKDVSLSKTAGNIGGSFDKVGGAVKAGAAIGATALAGLGAAVIGAGAKLIGLGSDAEEMLGKFDVVFSETGDFVKNELTNFADEVGRSKFELFEMASTFGDTLKPMGFAEEAAAGMAVELSQLATDLGSFNDMPMDESLQRLQGTLIGNHENALAFGVIINENTLKAELAAQGWDTLTGSALEQAKVQARINLLMQGTTDAQGDAARTSGSWANQMRALKATLTDTATEMGLKLLPIFTPLLARIGELALQAVPFLSAAFDNLIVFLTPVAAFILTLQQRFTAFQANTLPGLIARFNEVKNAVISFAEPIAAWIAQNVGLENTLIGLGLVLGGVVLSALVSIAISIGAILLPIIAVIAGVALLRAAWETDFLGIKTITIATIALMKIEWEKIKVLWAGLKITFSQLKLVIIAGALAIVTKANELKTTWTQVVTILKTKWDEFKTAFLDNPIVQGILDIVSAIGELSSSLSGLSLPAWLTPGSPTPWEIGMVGIRTQMKGLSDNELPRMNTQLQQLQQPSVSNERTINQSFTVNTSSVNLDRESRAGIAFATGGI